MTPLQQHVKSTRLTEQMGSRRGVAEPKSGAAKKRVGQRWCVDVGEIFVADRRGGRREQAALCSSRLVVRTRLRNHFLAKVSAAVESPHADTLTRDGWMDGRMNGLKRCATRHECLVEALGGAEKVLGPNMDQSPPPPPFPLGTLIISHRQSHSRSRALSRRDEVLGLCSAMHCIYITLVKRRDGRPCPRRRWP